MYSHSDLVEIVDRFEEHTRIGHEEARIRRRYVNNIQHTEDELRILKKRKQPVVVDNIIKRKTDYFLGVERQMRTDPKAYPRTPQHTEEAEAFTDGLRFECDVNDWDVVRSEGFDNLIVEGIEGFTVPLKNTKDGPRVQVNHIPWDRIIYDIHSSDRYFQDAKHKGMFVWMDLEDAIDLNPEAEDAIRASLGQDSELNSVFEDKPSSSWVNSTRERVKVVQLYFIQKKQWHHTMFVKGGYIFEPGPSAYIDEEGQPECPIELASAYVDQDNDRYGPVQDMISLQNLVNKSASKFQHWINQHQTWGNQKAGEVKKLKAEAPKPDGHFELQGDAKFGEDFGIVSTDNKAMGTFNILQEAKNSLSEIGGNQLLGPGESGRREEIASQKKLIELGPVLDAHRQCSKRVYRQIWNRIKQSYTDEWWVRITDDEKNLKFVALNQPMTYRMMIEEKYGQVPPGLESHPQIDQVVHGEDGQPLMVKNEVAKIDVDIVIEDAPDVVNIQQEQFEILSKLAQMYGPEEVPFEKMVKLSTLRGKEEFIEDTKGSEEERAQAEEMAMQKQQEAEEIAKAQAISEMENKDADTRAKDAKARKDKADAEAQMLENQIVQLELGIANG